MHVCQIEKHNIIYHVKYIIKPTAKQLAEQNTSAINMIMVAKHIITKKLTADPNSILFYQKDFMD